MNIDDSELMNFLTSKHRPEVNKNVDAIWEAVERSRLFDLKPGDVLIQIRYGEDYRYTSEDRPVVFVRYRNENDRFATDAASNSDECDIVIATGVVVPTGQLLTYFVDSTHYERVQSKNEV